MSDIWDRKPKPMGETSVVYLQWKDEFDVWLAELRAEDERKDGEYMSLLQNYRGLKRTYDNLLTQYEATKEEAQKLEAINEILDGSQSGWYFLPTGGYDINRLRDELRKILEAEE